MLARCERCQACVCVCDFSVVNLSEGRGGRDGVGGWSGEGPPGHISNPVVKLTSADGTAWVTVWESTSLPTTLVRLCP